MRRWEIFGPMGPKTQPVPEKPRRDADGTVAPVPPGLDREGLFLALWASLSCLQPALGGCP